MARSNTNVSLSWYRAFVLVLGIVHLTGIVGYTFFYFGRALFHPSAFENGAEYYWFLVGQMIAAVYAFVLFIALNGTTDCCSIPAWREAGCPIIGYLVVELINFILLVIAFSVRSANFDGQNCREVEGTTENCDRVNTLLIVGNILGALNALTSVIVTSVFWANTKNTKFDKL